MNDDLGLRWGIKASFVRYIASMADGTRRISGGAHDLHDGAFLFPIADSGGFSTQSGTGSLRFSGQIEFVGHLGMLYVCISTPWLQTDRDGTTLTIQVGNGGDRIPFARGGPVEPVDRDTGQCLQLRHLQLTVEAADLFFDVYPAGESVDPIEVLLPPR